VSALKRDKPISELTRRNNTTKIKNKEYKWLNNLTSLLLIKSGGGTGPMKPGNLGDSLSQKVPIPASRLRLEK